MFGRAGRSLRVFVERLFMRGFVVVYSDFLSGYIASFVIDRCLVMYMF